MNTIREILVAIAQWSAFILVGTGIISFLIGLGLYIQDRRRLRSSRAGKRLMAISVLTIIVILFLFAAISISSGCEGILFLGVCL